jgi:hypothetical protein
MTTESMVIVGAGEAASLRDRGFGDSIVLVGDEAHAPYERPPLSKAAITSDLAPRSQTIILDRRAVAEQSIYFHPDRVSRLITASALGPIGLIAKEIRTEEILLGRRAVSAAANLSNPSFKLKDLLKDVDVNSQTVA